MTISKLAFWSKSNKPAKVNNGDKKVKKFLSQLSGAFMLPISVMAVAGLFLGVGAAIHDHSSVAGVQTFGLFIKNLGDPVFGAMPILFMVAVIISFTDDIGTAVFSGLVGFLVFNAIQTPFIDQFTFKNAAGNDTTGVHYLFIDAGNDIASKLTKSVGTVAGITSLNTSIFAGIIAGIIVSKLYKKFHTIQLPAMISFFGGKRFVSFVAIGAMIPLAFIFLLVWPWIALGFAYFGEYSGKVAGLDSFLFGFVERSLIPFGLHHVFYAPLWYTGAGGDLSTLLTAGGHTVSAIDGMHTVADVQANAGAMKAWAAYASANKLTGAALTTPTDLNHALLAMITFPQGKSTTFLGDSYGWLAVNGSGVTKVNDTAIFKWFDNEGINFGRFMQGKFSFMQFGLPAAAVAMVMAAPKENRKMTLGTVFPAAMTSFVTGVTEPIEFTFLFLAPWLFFGFHALMAAFSFLAMNLLGAHVGMTFSGGIMDIMIYGALPFDKGTDFYWAFVIGAGYAPIYYFAFLFAIKKFDIQTPGRGTNTKLFTKADFKAKQAGEASSTDAPATKGALRAQSKDIVIAMGGWDNVTKYTNCATRLRYDVKDKSKVDEAGLKAAGAVGVVWQGSNHLQAIFGPQAEQINTNIKSNVGADLGVAQAAPAPKAEVKAEAKPAAKPAVKKAVADKKPAAKPAAKKATK